MDTVYSYMYIQNVPFESLDAIISQTISYSEKCFKWYLFCFERDIFWLS